jgi:hypothetical protein
LLSGCDIKPDPQQQAREACEATYGPLDWDILHSISWRHSAALENIPCDEQHEVLKELAGQAPSDRDEWLDAQIQNVRAAN